MISNLNEAMSWNCRSRAAVVVLVVSRTSVKFAGQQYEQQSGEAVREQPLLPLPPPQFPAVSLHVAQLLTASGGDM